MPIFKSISPNEFESYMSNEMKGKFVEVTRTLPASIQERVWDFPINDSMVIRIFSSLTRGGIIRDKGEDAIRVIVWSTKASKMLSGSKRVNRTEGALDRMRIRARGLYIKWKDLDVDCSICDDGVMSEREGKFGKFHGCTNYPKCKNVHKGDLPKK